MEELQKKATPKDGFSVTEWMFGYCFATMVVERLVPSVSNTV
jgi:hypothetical protein